MPVRVRLQGKAVTGWRAWLSVVPMALAAGVILVIFVGVALGIALTVATVLLIAIPIGVLIFLIAYALRRRPPRDMR